MSVTLSDNQARLVLKALKRASDAINDELRSWGWNGHITDEEQDVMRKRMEEFDELHSDVTDELEGGQDDAGDAGAAGAGAKTGVPGV